MTPSFSGVEVAESTCLVESSKENISNMHLSLPSVLICVWSQGDNERQTVQTLSLTSLQAVTSCVAQDSANILIAQQLSSSRGILLFPKRLFTS